MTEEPILDGAEPLCEIEQARLEGYRQALEEMRVQREELRREKLAIEQRRQQAGQHAWQCPECSDVYDSAFAAGQDCLIRGGWTEEIERRDQRRKFTTLWWGLGIGWLALCLWMASR